jgi:hypothetical protein
MTDDYTTDIYTKEGLKWIQDRSMTKVLLSAFSDDAEELPDILKNVENAFFPWV